MNARVNQKLYFAKLVLDTAQSHDGAVKTALLEAALLHLLTAYRCYLCEMADTPEITAADDAQGVVLQRQRLQLADKPELDELMQLEQAGAWPAQLLKACALVTASSEVPRVSAPASMIALADVTADVDADACCDWLDQFRQLLERQREHAQEW